jgi:hypothetical protein
MPDYSKALQDGFDRARKADAARKEIDAVFEDLKNQILTATDNKVSIERRRMTIPTPEISTVSAPGFFSLPAPPVRYWAIVAFNPNLPKEKLFELAGWEMDKAGYPCKVTWSKQEHICEDKNALTACLFELLSDPTIAEMLYTLTKLEQTKK